MHSGQITIDAARASELIHDQFPQFRGKAVAALNTAGTVNAIFRIGSRHAARFPLQVLEVVEGTRLLEGEARASAEFHSWCPVPSPSPIGVGRLGPAYPGPWLVQSWVDGHPATPNGLSPSPAFTRDLIDLIISLRAVALNGRVFDGPGRGGHLQDHDDWMAVCFSRSEQLFEVARLRLLWASLRDLPSPKAQVMSHKDLIPGNLLVRGDRMVGVLDTGGFGPADPSLDLVAGWHLLDRDSRAIFRDALQADALAWRRSAAWALEQAMGLVWYYRNSNQIMSELGRSTISRLLEDYDELV